MSSCGRRDFRVCWWADREVCQPIRKKKDSSMRNTRTIAIVLLTLSTLTGAFLGTGVAAGSSDLARAFVSPPQSARPWVYWFWLDGNITREGITADLEAMRRVGVGGGLVMEGGQGGAKGPAR